MHAVYHYLMHLDPQGAKDKGFSLVQQAESLFESYAETHLDENNWYAPIDVVMKNGEYLKDFKEASGRYGAASEPPTWDEAFRFALDCVVTDMEITDFPYLALVPPNEEQKKIRDEWDKKSFDEAVSFVLDYAPEKLKKLYDDVKGKPVTEQSRFDLEGYRRARLAVMFEKFRDCAFIPFSRSLSSPYRYRAYDLTDSYAGGEPNAIFRLDIHT